MIGQTVGTLAKYPTRFLYRYYSARPGIGNTMRVAKFYNRLRYAQRHRLHRDGFENRLDELLAGNGWADPRREPIVMNDGWAIDESNSLPHLAELLEDADKVIAERGGQNRVGTRAAQQPFLFNLSLPGDWDKFPSFLNFITSSELLSTVSRYMGTIPVLSKTLPPGQRFAESSSKFDEHAGGSYRESQLYHLDFHDSPMVYVIVLLKDTTPASGPWCFLSKSVSDQAVERLDYRARSEPYRVVDERMYQHVDKEQMIEFVYPRGTVLFIDSSQCFHYGSRDAAVTRYQMMYALTTPCRCDFTQTFMPIRTYPVNESDPELRRMVTQ